MHHSSDRQADTAADHCARTNCCASSRPPQKALASGNYRGRRDRLGGNLLGIDRNISAWLWAVCYFNDFRGDCDLFGHFYMGWQKQAQIDAAGVGAY